MTTPPSPPSAEPDPAAPVQGDQALPLMTRLPGVPLAVAASALRERIYGSIACLSTLLVLTTNPLQHPWSRAADVLIATGGLWAASILAELVAHLGAHNTPPTARELRHILWVSGQIMAASAVPVLLLVLAGVGALALHTAVWTGVWVLVAEMAVFAYLAVRSTSLGRAGQAMLILALVVLGVLVIALKTLAH